MIMRYTILCLLGISLILSGAESKWTQGNKYERIFDGSSTYDDKNFMVAIFSQDTFTCNGFLVTPEFVLTAASCIRQEHLPNMKVRVGSSRRSSGGKFYDVKNGYPHPSYDMRVKYNNIGLLELKESVPNAEVLPLARMALPRNHRVTVYGWGQLTPQGQLAENLQYAEATVISRPECQSKYEKLVPPLEITKNMFCTDSFLGGPCFGDTGAPALYQDAALGMYIGGSGCGKNYPGVYIYFRNYFKWLKETTKGQVKIEQRTIDGTNMGGHDHGRNDGR